MGGVYKVKVRGKDKYVCDIKNDFLNTRERKYFNKKYEAEEYYKKYFKELNTVKAKVSGDPKSLIKDRFMEFASINYDNIDTRKGFISKYNNYLDDFYGNKTIECINPKLMENLRLYISGIKNNDGNVISSTLKEAIWEKNKTFITWLKNKEEIPTSYDYFVGLKNFCNLHKQHTKKCMELDDFIKFVNCVDNLVEKTYFTGLFTLGTRKSEQNNLRFKDVKEMEGEISIEAQYIDKTHGETVLKTDDSRRLVPINKTFFTMVEILRNKRKKYGLSDEDVDNMYIYLNDKGNVIPKETMRRHYKIYLKKAKLSPNYRLHDLRGSFATRMIDETGNLELVRQLLGHADIRTTMAYITPSKKAKDKVRELNEIKGIEITESTNEENENE